MRSTKNGPAIDALDMSVLDRRKSHLSRRILDLPKENGVAFFHHSQNKTVVRAGPVCGPLQKFVYSASDTWLSSRLGEQWQFLSEPVDVRYSHCKL
jgi:hypothetical protein